MYATLYEDVLYEILKLKQGFQVRIYLSKYKGIFINSNKAFGDYFLEQTFDSNDNLISEKIKKNPHRVEWGDIDYDDDYD